MENTNQLTVQTTVQAPISKVWQYWNEPSHITNWCSPSPDWHAPAADNDLRVGGKFSTTMAAKDGSFSFDFAGVYDDVKEHQLMAYTINDGRKVKITFSSEGGATTIVESFDPENINSLEMQQAGWQAIIDNFRSYTEAN